MRLAMQGVKVLDFSMGLAGPEAGMLCAQQGADVIKVESLEGDWSRTLGHTYGDLSAYATVCNRGKRSLSIDLKDEQGREAVKVLSMKADVVIEAFRPGVMDRFGLGYETLSKVNSNLVYLSVNGFGSSGPLVKAPATDAVVQAFSGFMHCNKDSEGVPQRLNLFIIDLVTGLYAYQAIANALLEQARTGAGGRHIECSLLNSAVALQAGKILEQHLESGDQSYYVPLGVYGTADGHVSLSVRRDDHFAQLCAAIGRSDLNACGRYVTNVQRIARKEELEGALREEFGRLSTAKLSEILTHIDILHSRVNSHAELLSEAQVEHSGVIFWTRQDGVGDRVPLARIPGAIEGMDSAQAPHIGEHSSSALLDWGVDKSVVDDLAARGVLIDTKPVTIRQG